MRKLFVLSLVLGITIWTTARGADDPGKAYADAFILAQDGQSAEANSDWATAAAKYNAAADLLRELHSSNPDWNPQVVEFRLKDVNGKLDAIKGKAPATPPPSVAVEPVTAPAPAPAPAATPAPAPAPGSLAVEFATPQATSRLRAEVDRLKEENSKLASELDTARKTPAPTKSDKQVDQLKQQNQQLAAQLADAEKQTADLKQQLTTKPAPGDTAETKKLRTELAQTRAQLDNALKSNQGIADLQRQNKELQAKLVDAQKNAAAAGKAPSESADLKKLRAELNKAREEADQAKQALAKAEAASKERADVGQQLADLEKQNATLRSQLASAKSAPQPTAPAPVDTGELKKLRSDLANARAELDKTNKANQQQMTDLQRQNKDLAAQLASAKKKPASPVSESAELKKLHAELDAAHAEVGRSKAAAARVTELEKQNQQLTAQLAANPATTSADAELKKLRADLADARAAADRAKQANANAAGLEQENKYLAAQLAASRRDVATSPPGKNFGPGPKTTTSSSTELAALQKQNADLQALLEDAKRQAAAKPVVVNAGQSTALAQQNKELTGKLNASQQRVVVLEKQVAAKPTVNAGQSTALTQQNRELTGKLNASQLRVADMEKQVSAKTATAPANSAELKKLRADLATAQAEADRAKQASAKADETARQNQALTGQLAAQQKRVSDLEKQVAGRSATPADAGQLKKLQADLADARAELDRTKKANANTTALVQQNQALSTQLAAAKGQSAELQQTRTELAAAQAEAQAAQAGSARAAELEKQNNELAAQLEEAKKGPYIRPLSTEESAQIRQLRNELDEMNTEVNRAKSANAQMDELAKQNADLKAQLEDAHKNAITRVEVVDMNPPGRQIAPAALSQKDAAMMKKLREENSYMRNLLETYAAKNPELKPRLKAYQPKPTTTNAPAATTSK